MPSTLKIKASERDSPEKRVDTRACQAEVGGLVLGDEDVIAEALVEDPEQQMVWKAKQSWGSLFEVKRSEIRLGGWGWGSRTLYGTVCSIRNCCLGVCCDVDVGAWVNEVSTGQTRLAPSPRQPPHHSCVCSAVTAYSPV